MAEVKFWTHGVNTIVEYPDRATNLRHAGWGTLIQQPADPSGRHNNWFHLALHTPEAVTHGRSGRGPEVSRAFFAYAQLKASLNENASIRELHIRAGNRLIHREDVDLRGPNVDYQVDARTPWRGGLRDHDLTDEGVVLCVRAEFLSGEPEGHIIILGAGSYFRHVQS